MAQGVMVREDGTTKRIDIPETGGSLSVLVNELDCPLVDVIRLDGLDMWIDDEGNFSREANLTATSLAVSQLYPGRYTFLVRGPVIFAGVTPDGETIGLPAETVDQIINRAALLRAAWAL